MAGMWWAVALKEVMKSPEQALVAAAGRVHAECGARTKSTLLCQRSGGCGCGDCGACRNQACDAGSAEAGLG